MRRDSLLRNLFSTTGFKLYACEYILASINTFSPSSQPMLVSMGSMLASMGSMLVSMGSMLASMGSMLSSKGNIALVHDFTRN